MKTRNLSIYFMVIALAVLMVQCTKEGPIGPAGADGLSGTDGTDGVDGNVTCLACHSTAAKEAIDFQFQRSAHNAGAIAVDYAGGQKNCARCHSHEGFVEFASTGTVAADISNPSAWQCQTCHNIHETFTGADFALRLASAFDWVATTTVEAVDMGNSNLCANCHQARVSEPNIATPGATFAITSTHYGPHHGAQANVLYGKGFAEIVGSTSYAGLNGTGVHMNADARCTGCHMDNAAGALGGHTWNPNVATCNACHATTDFNYGDVQTDTQAQLDVLRDLLMLPNVGVVAGDAVNGYHPVVATFDMVLVQAFFNWVGLEEDRSLGVHNPKYVDALLSNSIEAVTTWSGLHP